MFETVELTAGTTRASVIPARGALVSRFTVGGDDVLFLDRASLEDPSKNVRGGIPILFPFAGKPPPGSTLKQHGFARTLQWAVVRQEPSALVCALEPTAATRAAFPHEFRLELTVAVTDRQLRLGLVLSNAGATPMPVHFGLHPYFAVPLEAKARAHVDTTATCAYDQRVGSTGALAPIDFSAGETDVHLLDHAAPRTVLHAHRDLALEWSETFSTLVLWTLPGQPFICVEPWSAPTATFGARTLAPGGAEAFDFRIRAL